MSKHFIWCLTDCSEKRTKCVTHKRQQCDDLNKCDIHFYLCAIKHVKWHLDDPNISIVKPLMIFFPNRLSSLYQYYSRQIFFIITTFAKLCWNWQATIIIPTHYHTTYKKNVINTYSIMPCHHHRRIIQN